MENKLISTLQVLTLVEKFIVALLSKMRSGNYAKKLIRHEAKIESLVRNIFGNPLGYNFFENKMFLSGWFADDDSCPNNKETRMTTKQALEISKIFGKYLCSISCSDTEIEKLIKDKERILSLVDDLFEMSPAFNLFEYNRFVKRAPLASFKEVYDWNKNAFIVCTTDKVCEPYGFKSGDRVFSHGPGYLTVVGVAPIYSPGEVSLAIWMVDDKNGFRGPVVRAYSYQSLKKADFTLAINQ